MMIKTAHIEARARLVSRSKDFPRVQPIRDSCVCYSVQSLGRVAIISMNLALGLT
jgi:hypothetical protein